MEQSHFQEKTRNVQFCSKPGLAFGPENMAGAESHQLRSHLLGSLAITALPFFFPPTQSASRRGNVVFIYTWSWFSFFFFLN